MRVTLWEGILGVIMWLLVLAGIVWMVGALACSMEPPVKPPKYKYTVWSGSAAFAVGHGTDRYKIGTDGTLLWFTRDGRSVIESSGTWRVEELAP